MTRKEEFVKIYEYLQGKLTNNPAYEFTLKRKDREKLEKFLDNEVVGNLWNYLTFQFNRQVFLLQVSGLPMVPFRNVISNKAIERWRHRTRQEMWFTSKFVMEHDLFNPIEKENTVSENYMDKQRKLYFDSSKGFILCESFDGFLFDLEKCQGCRFIRICEEKYKER